MVFSNEKIREILDIIKAHHIAFVYNNITQDVDKDLIKLIKEFGLDMDKDQIQSFLKDGYQIERLRSLLENARDNNLTYKNAKDLLKQTPVKLTDTELSSIEHVEQTAGQYITKHGDLLKNSLEELIRETNIDFKQDVLNQTIRKPLKEGIEKRKTIGQIASRMRELSEDQFRNFHRIAFTELQNARNHSKIDQVYESNKGKKETEILVFKRPSPDACVACKSVYLEKDGVTPKVFTMAEFKKNISNFGLKAKKFMPTIESIHPNCACELGQLPPGFGFDEDGQMKFMGLNKKPKISKPKPAEENWKLYDSNGNLKKSKIIDKLNEKGHNCSVSDEIRKADKSEFTVDELLNILKKVDDENG